MFSRYWQCCLVAILISMSATMSSADLIVNGSFEEGFPVSGTVYTVLPGSNDMPGWVIGGDGVDWHLAATEEDGAHFGPAYDGIYVADLNRNGASAGTLSQSISTVAGGHYSLVFHFAGCNWFTDPRLVQIDVAGQNILNQCELSGIMAPGQTCHPQATGRHAVRAYSSPPSRYGHEPEPLTCRQDSGPSGGNSAYDLLHIDSRGVRPLVAERGRD